MKRRICGFEIEDQSAKLANDPPPVVMMHRLGQRDMMFFTPTEARAFAMTLNEAADAAEGKPTP